MLDQIGWWTFVTETHTLINRVSDQRIPFESAVDEAGSLLHPPASGPARFRFSYEDAEVCYITAIVTGSKIMASLPQDAAARRQCSTFLIAPDAGFRSRGC